MVTDALHLTPSEPADRVDDGLPPLDDPYLGAPAALPPPKLSGLALTSVIAPLTVPILGSVAGIVFGWFALREIEASGDRRRGQGLAKIGIALGIINTMLCGAGLSFLVWTSRYGGADTPAGEQIAIARDPGAPAPASTPGPGPQASVPQGYVVPKTTTTKQAGAVTLVDVGVSATSLSEALAKQRAEASTAGETMLVMTTAGRCEPCDGFDASLRDPLMQTALANVRLVRVDTTIFGEDLDALKIPYEHIPGFFLLSANLTPRDGIDGGEWDEDIARNIAPVLGAFVRGKYTARREPWKALPGSGMRL